MVSTKPGSRLLTRRPHYDFSETRALRKGSLGDGQTVTRNPRIFARTLGGRFPRGIFPGAGPGPRISRADSARDKNSPAQSPGIRFRRPFSRDGEDRPLQIPGAAGYTREISEKPEFRNDRADARPTSPRRDRPNPDSDGHGPARRISSSPFSADSRRITFRQFPRGPPEKTLTDPGF